MLNIAKKHIKYSKLFLKDVEMAEVMTDNDLAVAKILTSYEIADLGEDENDPVEVPPNGSDQTSSAVSRSSDERTSPKMEVALQEKLATNSKSKPVKRGSKTKSKSTKGCKAVKNVLGEIKNGRVSKRK